MNARLIYKSLNLLVVVSLLLGSSLSPASQRTAARAQANPAFRYEYDANGNLITRTDMNGVTTRYEYDALNRLVRIRYPDGSGVTYEYNAAGLRTRMVDALGTTTYTYDPQGQMTQVTDPHGYTLHYRYDPRGLVSQITYPDGNQVGYEWDADYRLTTVVDSIGRTSYTYDPTGLVSQRTLPNGVVTQYTYNASLQLTAIRHLAPGGNPLLEIEYAYDAVGNRLQMVRKEAGGENQVTQYEYDPSYRLVKVTYPDRSLETYSYDAVGNRLSMNSSTNGETRYTYDGFGRLTHLQSPQGQEDFTYNANGCLEEQRVDDLQGLRTIQYKWDYENRLVGMIDGDQEVQFQYDGNGTRLGEMVNGQATKYLYDRSSIYVDIVATVEPNGTLTKYTSGLERLGELAESEQSTYYLTDGFDTVVAKTGDQGSLLETFQYDPFGQQLTVSPTSDQSPVERQLEWIMGFLYHPAARLLLPAVFPFSYTSVSLLNIAYDTRTAQVLHDLRTKVPEWLRTGYDFVKIPVKVVGEIEKNKEYFDKNFSGYAWIHKNAKAIAGIAKVAGWVGYTLTGWDVFKAFREGKWGLVAVKGIGFWFKAEAVKVVVGLLIMAGVSFGPAAAVGLGVGYLTSQFIDLIEDMVNLIYEYDSLIQQYEEMIDKYGNTAEETTKCPPNCPMLPPPYIYQDDYWDHSLKPFFPPDDHGGGGGAAVGGVSLDRTAQVLVENMNEITGATVDPQTGQIVLIGRMNSALPPLDPDDLAVALRTVFSGQQPSMSMEPCNPGSNDGCMKVLYNGRFQLPSQTEAGWVMYDASGQLVQADAPATFGTHFGWVIYESDRFLKIASLGIDNLNPQKTFQTNVPGFISEIERMASTPDRDIDPDDKCLILTEADRQRPSSCHRMWFVPSEIVIRLAEDGRTMIFDPVTIRTEARFVRFDQQGKMVDVPGNDPAVDAFVQFFNDHYAEFAQEKKELAELIELAKITSLALWLRDQDIPVDLGWLASYQPEEVSTPLTTPGVWAEAGNMRLYGGVELPSELTYTSDGGDTSQITSEALETRPSHEATTWSFQHEEETLNAVSLSLSAESVPGAYTSQVTDLQLTAAAGLPVSFSRVYNSSDLSASPLGPGWAYLPYRMSLVEYDKPVDGKLYQRVTRAFVRKGAEQTLFSGPYQHEGSEQLFLQPEDSLSPYQDVLILEDGYVLRGKDGILVYFDPMGKLAAIENTAGNRTNYVWDDAGRLASISAGDGRQIDLVYNSQGNLANVQASNEQEIRFGYNEAGYLVEVRDEADTLLARYTYDSQGRLKQVSDSSGLALSELRYDALGRLVASGSSERGGYQLAYNDQDNTTVVTNPAGQANTYQLGEGNQLLSVTDPLQNKVSYEYDPQGRLARATDAAGNITAYEYDAIGNLNALVFADGSKTQFFYDEQNHPQIVIDPTGGIAFYEYDEQGHLIRVENGYQLENMEPDSSLNYSGEASVTSYQYNGNGKLSAIQDPAGNITQFTYDAAGKLASVRLPGGDEMELTFDDRSRLKSLVDAAGNKVTFAYDEQGGLEQVVTASGSYHYTRGQLTAIMDALGQSTTYSYTPQGWLASTIKPDGTTITYGYDTVGNLVEVTDPLGMRTAYTYDAVGHLVAEAYQAAAGGSGKQESTPEVETPEPEDGDGDGDGGGEPEPTATSELIAPTAPSTTLEANVRQVGTATISERGSPSAWIFILPAGVLLGGGLAVFLIVRKRRARIANDSQFPPSDDFSINDDFKF